MQTCFDIIIINRWLWEKQWKTGVDFQSVSGTHSGAQVCHAAFVFEIYLIALSN